MSVFSDELGNKNLERISKRFLKWEIFRNRNWWFLPRY